MISQQQQQVNPHAYERLLQARDAQLRVAVEKHTAISDAAAADKAAAATQLASLKQLNSQERTRQDELLCAAEAAAGSHAEQAQSLRRQLVQHTLESEAVKRLAQEREAALQRDLVQARQDAEDAVASGRAAAEHLRLQRADSEAVLQQRAAADVAAAESALADRCAEAPEVPACMPLPHSERRRLRQPCMCLVQGRKLWCAAADLGH